uniref:YDG domain-containing protein n=1 Tax=mine drainage metagenome TaxID=410659 RepID=E6QKW7_9ZZZZ
MRLHRWGIGLEFLGMAVAAGVLMTLAGCRVRTSKVAGSEEKHVQVDTPFGGIHVNTDETTAADIGLPIYPGASVATDDADHKSADVRMGFGQWQLRVKVARYATPDPEAKVEGFYRNALKRYGNVIECVDHKPVGTLTQTSEGLTCEDSGKSGSGNAGGLKVDTDADSRMELKAGSRHHQHIVGLDTPKNSQLGTHFALVVLDLPSGGDDKAD